MKIFASLLLSSCLVGCESVPFNDSLEYAWQGMHVIDVLQTANGTAANPVCHSEGNALTRGLIGKHPSKDDVYKWGIGSAITHFFLFKFVDRYFNGGEVNIALRFIDTGSKLLTINSNHANGIRIRGDGLSTKAKAKCERENPSQFKLEIKF